MPSPPITKIFCHSGASSLTGEKYDPLKIGLTYATYVHGDGLSGLLMLDEITQPDFFTWEINRASLSKHDFFWGPLDMSKFLRPHEFKSLKLDPKIRVGWRGPALRRSDAEKLPRKLTYYDTWWDDYGVMRYHDLMRKK